MKSSLLPKHELEQSTVFPTSDKQFEKICELERLLAQQEQIILKLESDNSAMSIRLASLQETNQHSTGPLTQKLAIESAALKEMNRNLLHEVDRLKARLVAFEQAHPATGNQNSNLWMSDVNWRTGKFLGSHSSVDR